MTTNSKGLLDLPKKELVDIIHELKAKVKEIEGIEKSQLANISELKELALGAVKLADGTYGIVKIAYDVDKNSAQIAGVEKLGTKDPDILGYNMTKQVVEKIVRKLRGDKYV
jgi:hypothetical protein